MNQIDALMFNIWSLLILVIFHSCSVNFWNLFQSLYHSDHFYHRLDCELSLFCSEFRGEERKTSERASMTRLLRSRDMCLRGVGDLCSATFNFNQLHR